MTITRRGFLSASAALAATPMFSGSGFGAAPPREADIVVIGAGAAGIAAARRILAANRKVIVIEAASQVGGPMGFRTLDALQRLGTDHAQTLFGLANQPLEWAWYAIAAIIALWAGR